MVNPLTFKLRQSIEKEQISPSPTRMNDVRLSMGVNEQLVDFYLNVRVFLSHWFHLVPHTPPCVTINPGKVHLHLIFTMRMTVGEV